MTARAIPIIALDVPTADAAVELARTLSGECRFLKVGNELFTAAGPDVVRRLRDEGAEIFLDLKLHDIPNTVAGAVRSAASLGVRLLTVHVSGGASMLRAAQDAAAGGVGLLGVTVLTSLDEAELGETWGRRIAQVSPEVVRLAGLAAGAGLHGVVCAGSDAGAVRSAYGERLSVLVPGIRLAGGAANDQQRVATPASAQAAGARYLVLGRAVTAAADPVAAMRQVMAQLSGSDAG